jgi:hypothetical protein
VNNNFELRILAPVGVPETLRPRRRGDCNCCQAGRGVRQLVVVVENGRKPVHIAARNAAGDSRSFDLTAQSCSIHAKRIPEYALEEGVRNVHMNRQRRNAICGRMSQPDKH